MYYIFLYNTFMRTLTVPSSAVSLRSDKPLTPAMVAAVWEIAAALDEQHIPIVVPNSIWLEIPAKKLRGEGGRSDNVWLRQCLKRLTGVQVAGEHRGDPWGAVILAEWHITEGGSIARLSIPPGGVQALRSPQNFTKIEAFAAHRLTGHGRQLYAILADKNRLGRPSWTFDLSEIRSLMNVGDKKSYEVWGAFSRSVLGPALDAINDYGTVDVRMTPQKIGRSVAAVRFDWKWKDPHEATEAVAENERHSEARRKVQDTTDAPPMIEDQEQPEPALTWWHGLTDAEREDWGERVGRTFLQEGPGSKSIKTVRRELDIARLAYEEVSTNA